MKRGKTAGRLEARLHVGLLVSWSVLALTVAGAAHASTAHGAAPTREEIAEACAYAAAIPAADSGCSAT